MCFWITFGNGKEMVTIFKHFHNQIKTKGDFITLDYIHKHLMIRTHAKVIPLNRIN